VTEAARREYAQIMAARYHVASKMERSEILTEYCRTTGAHRKSAIRRLGREPQRSQRRAGRPPRYGPELLAVLERIWRASGELCGKLLQPIAGSLLRALESHHGLRVADAQRAALLAASPATLDRLLRPLRARRARQPRRLAPAVGTLRAQVPVRTWREWTGVAPGAVQGDLVLHCGESTAGFYLATLVIVDVATSWTELQALWGLQYYRVRAALDWVRRRLPFPLHHWHSDNGSEFLNAGLLAWCRRYAIAVSRGRPYHKNDQAWVEQRNGLLIRRLVGYDRYSSRAALALLRRLYELVTLHHNFFRPVRKLLRKERVGSKVVKRYDAPRTPYQRVLAGGLLTPDQQRSLEQQFRSLDPVALARDIQRTLDQLWKCADHRAIVQEIARG
jgi:hypothetical protein